MEFVSVNEEIHEDRWVRTKGGEKYRVFLTHRWKLEYLGVKQLIYLYWRILLRQAEEEVLWRIKKECSERCYKHLFPPYFKTKVVVISLVPVTETHSATDTECMHEWQQQHSQVLSSTNPFKSIQHSHWYSLPKFWLKLCPYVSVSASPGVNF